jgi:hypothetical protein
VGRALGEKNWSRVQPPGVPVSHQSRDSNVTGWDSHNYLRLALSRDGVVHLSGNLHSNPLVYYRTRAPFDVATLERFDRMTGERETHCTYPVFFNSAAGELLFRYRDGSSGNGSDLYNRYDETKGIWSRLLSTPLLDGEGKRNAYALDPVLGPDGKFHLVWMWRDTPDCSTNNHLSYARSPDFIHWENSRGEPLKLPITLATAEVIDPAKVHEGLINMTFALGFDGKKNPVVTYHRYDAQHHSQIYAAHPRASDAGWETRQISDWNFTWAFAGGGSIPAEVALGAPRLESDGTLLVDFSSRAASDGRWRLRADTLERSATLPAAPQALPEKWLQPQSTYPGMEVQTVITHANGKRWVLRWETLPRNRDEPRSVTPPPTELRLFEFPDNDTTNAVRVGS